MLFQHGTQPIAYARPWAGGKQPARFAILYIEQPYFPYPRRGHSPGRIQHNPYRVIITVRPGWLNLRRA